VAIMNFSSKKKILESQNFKDIGRNLRKTIKRDAELSNLESDALKIKIEKKIFFKKMFTMLVASSLFAPAIALSHCYFGFLIYILSIVFILYSLCVYYNLEGQDCTG